MSPFFSSLYKYQYHLRLWLTGKFVFFKKKLLFSKYLPFNKENKSPKTLLIIAGLIGDSTMCVPVIIEAKKIWPGSRTTVLGRKHNLELLQDSPFIDEFYETPVMPFSIKGKKKEKKLLKWLKEQKFDIAIILLGDQFAKVLDDAGIPCRVGVKGHFLQSSLTHTYDIGSPVTWTPDERLNSLRCLGYQVTNNLPALWINSSTSEITRKKLNQQGLDKSSYIVLHPFGSSQRQWWNLNTVSALVHELYKEYGLQTVLIGGKETVGIVPAVEHIIDTTGKITLTELKAVIANAEMIITTDSGPLHIAGAFRKKTIGLFRSRRPELAYVYPNVQVIFGKNSICQLKCRWDYCRNKQCEQMHNIGSQEVLEESKKLLT